MIRFTTAAFMLGACLTVPMLAQTAPSSTQTSPSNQAQPMQTPAQNNQMTSPAQGAATSADLTGQAIYTTKGKKIGTVAAMTMGSHGEQAASVTMERYLGMGGQTVLIPVSSLKARSAGGYSTNLSSTELKALPKANTGKMQ